MSQQLTAQQRRLYQWEAEEAGRSDPEQYPPEVAQRMRANKEKMHEEFPYTAHAIELVMDIPENADICPYAIRRAAILHRHYVYYLLNGRWSSRQRNTIYRHLYWAWAWADNIEIENFAVPAVMARIRTELGILTDNVEVALRESCRRRGIRAANGTSRNREVSDLEREYYNRLRTRMRDMSESLL